jgi:hypothetical protein
LKQKFFTLLYSSSTWVCVAVPFNVQEAFGTKGRMAVKGTLNGLEFRSSLFPNGDGTHFMMINKTMQKSTGLKVGDTAKIEIEEDTETRTLKVPEDVSATLHSQPEVEKTFKRYSYSVQKEWLNWIEEAKQPKTRKRRIEKVVQELMGKTP